MMATSSTNAPPASPVTEAPSQSAPSQHRDTTSIDDHALPKSVIVRLAKSVLPENTMLQKEAVAALVKSATVFVNYLAATANDVTQHKGKKTINNEEILAALEIAELDMMIPQLKKHIERRLLNGTIELMVEFEITRREKRKKSEQDEDGRKKRKLEGGIAEEVAAETNGDDGDTEIEKATEDGDSVDERDEPEEHDQDDEAEGDIEVEEREGEEESLAIDMDENEEDSDGEEMDEALIEDSD